MNQLNGHFRPEFLNRIDEVILFKPLSLGNIKDIVSKLVVQLQARLTDQHITIDMTEKAKEFVARNGFDPKFGARPLRRYLQKTIETLLAKDIIAGKVKEKDHVLIDEEEEQINLKHTL
ncbi:hypothetical protein ACEF17_11570 [Streptococcus hyovaginalis]